MHVCLYECDTYKHIHIDTESSIILISLLNCDEDDDIQIF